MSGPTPVVGPVNGLSPCLCAFILVRSVEQAPDAPLGSPLPSLSGWNEATFFDGELRISRGNRGNYYLLRRLLPPA